MNFLHVISLVLLSLVAQALAAGTLTLASVGNDLTSASGHFYRDAEPGSGSLYLSSTGAFTVHYTWTFTNEVSSVYGVGAGVVDGQYPLIATNKQLSVDGKTYEYDVTFPSNIPAGSTFTVVEPWLILRDGAATQANTVERLATSSGVTVAGNYQDDTTWSGDDYVVLGNGSKNTWMLLFYAASSSSVQRESTSFTISHSLDFNGAVSYSSIFSAYFCGNAISASNINYNSATHVLSFDVVISGGTAGEYCNYDAPGVFLSSSSASSVTFTSSVTSGVNLLGADGGTLNW